MNNYKQGSFYYHKKPNGKYIEVHYPKIISPSIREVYESTAIDSEYPNIEITEKEFKMIFVKVISEIAGFEIEQFNEDELHLSDVQK